jgi:hypothetical protein
MTMTSPQPSSNNQKATSNVEGSTLTPFRLFDLQTEALWPIFPRA